MPARILHWLVAAAVPVQWSLGWIADTSSDRAHGFSLLRGHFQLGMLILVLMVLRASWRIASGTPVPPADIGRSLGRLAELTHELFYLLLFTLPVSGYIVWVWMDAPMGVVGLFEVPRVFTPPSDDETGRALAWYIHHYANRLLLLLMALHVSAALWHEFVRRDRVLRRMV